ncbi:MAG TPA: PAS domain-containing sensor histidine kinase, partial [Candidatus Thermoplasmatota archaeon]|nr:PAS domain-containing sensor histidine kinase [Candidatus Thermoplasmatota archaeon]
MAPTPTHPPRRALGPEEVRRLLGRGDDPAALHEDGRLVAVNPAFAALFGATPKEMEGQGLLTLLDPASHATVLEALRGHLKGPFEVGIRRKDGGSVAATGRIEEVDLPGRPLRRIHLSRLPGGAELAALRLAEIEKLREMGQFKTRILNMAAHELNTPLTPLRLQTHLLLSGSLGPLEARQRHAVEILDRNVTRLATLVQEILDVARLQGGRLKVTPAPVDLGSAIEEAADSFAETARRLGIDLAAQVEPGLVVQADRGRLLQILFNLLSNALKFTPQGGGVRVHAKAEGGMVRIEVTDTGTGMAPDQLARLFQPFTQVHDTNAITVPGTGLGLYICRGLAEAMGGRIEVASPGPGQGSTFRLHLPVSMEPPPPRAPAAPARQPTPQDALA